MKTIGAGNRISRGFGGKGLGVALCAAALLMACSDDDSSSTPPAGDVGMDTGLDVIDPGDADAIVEPPDVTEETDEAMPDAADTVTPDDTSDVMDVMDVAGDADAMPVDVPSDGDAMPADLLTDVVLGDTDIASLRTGAAGILTDVVVTALKPAWGDDPAGFFLQEGATGPAIFIRVDAATTDPVLAAGDRITVQVNAVELDVQGRAEGTSISGLSVTESGVDTAPWVQDVNAATDLVSALGDYEAELITLTGTITEGVGGAGAGYLAVTIDTAGLTGADLRLRLSTAIESTIPFGSLGVGCTFTMKGVMWRFFDTAQALPLEDADLVIDSCSPLKVTTASATTTTSAVVRFDRGVEPSSVLSDGSQFTIAGLTISNAVASGAEVTLTTDAQAEIEYTVVVADTVLDFLGGGVDATANSATFTGFGVCASDAAGDVFISELVDHDVDFNARFMELYNGGPTPVDLATWSLRRYTNGSATVSQEVALSGTLAPCGTYIIALSLTSFEATFTGMSADMEHPILNANGDDAFELFDGVAIADFYGEAGVDGTATAWDYEDSVATRAAGITSGNPTWTAAEWAITAGAGAASPGAHTP